MSNQPTLTPKTELPDAVRALCEQVHAVADGLPVLLFLPDATHARLHPLVVVPDDATAHARLVAAYLQGEPMTPPADTLAQRHDASLEAIHAAAGYVPTIVFVPDGEQLHPINLVPETVPQPLRPCYVAVQRAQKTAIGTAPIEVTAAGSE